MTLKPPDIKIVRGIEWHDVESSNIERIGWVATNRYDAGAEDLRTGWLFVLFRNNGRVYAYPQVPEQVFQAILHAESVGQRFNRLVRNSGQNVELTTTKGVT